jgi:hypothetical protein
MKSVIIVAHGFPPEGSAGVYRPLRFVRHLPQMGWRPIVVSCEKSAFHRYDPGLLALIPPETEIRRVRGRDLWQSFQTKRAMRLQQKLALDRGAMREGSHATFDTPTRSLLRQIARTLEAWCYHPDMEMGWIRPAVRETVRLCAHAPVDVIWATAGPVSAFVVAHRASRRTGVPYVLDFRDAWTITGNDFEALRPLWATRRDRHNLHRMLKGARAVIFRYHEEAECFWRAYAGALDASKIHIIPNGYEGSVDTSAIPDGNKCTIVYTGMLSSYRFDTLLDALHKFKRYDPDRAKRLSFLFVGEGTEALCREIDSLDLRDLVEGRGPSSHSETTNLHRKAHALLILGRPNTLNGYELFVGAKFFEYLKAGRPIIGVLPADETRKILNRVGVSTVADVESPAEIMAVLRKLVDAWTTRSIGQLLPDRAACEAFSAGRQTAALVRALDGDLAAEPFVPGTVEIPPSLRHKIEAATWSRLSKKTDVEPMLARN